MSKPKPVSERLARHTTKTDSCWIWNGYLSPDGYGRIKMPDGAKMVHRVAYEQATGETIPPKMTIDHLCRNRACVNPQHLEVVSNRTNTMRGHGSKPACKYGHEFTPENTRRDKDGHRFCKKCAYIRTAERRNKLRAMGLCVLTPFKFGRKKVVA